MSPAGKQDVSVSWVVLIFRMRRHYFCPTLSGILRSNCGPAKEIATSCRRSFSCQRDRLAFRQILAPVH